MGHAAEVGSAGVDSNNHLVSTSRRRALKGLGAAGATGLAGCSSLTGGEGDTTGTTITLWTTLQGQSSVAEQFLQQTINQYEERTGNTVEWIKETVSNV
ncbi:MAG: twin-arginine translocation signal domain-containing protein [Halobacteriaceae archaeon]